tara:strand:+ start:984 stop:1298 length:315 start_codon:yes stop_codon:yes gene_type:complete
MKEFVFNFTSNNINKFSLGSELYNLLTTALIFDQSVTLILGLKEDSLNINNLLFLTNVITIPGKFRLVSKKNITNFEFNYLGIELLTNEEMENLIAGADYCVNC